MSKIKERFKVLEQERLQHESMLEAMESEAEKLGDIRFGLQGVTLRISPFVVVAIDQLAKHHDMSRQEFLSQLVIEGIEEAVDGTFDVYDKPDECKKEFYDEVKAITSEAFK